MQVPPLEWWCMNVGMRVLQQWADDPFRRAENERGTPVDAAAWRLSSRFTMTVALIITLFSNQLLPGTIRFHAMHALYCEAAALVASRKPAFYARFREPIAFVGWLHQAWTMVQIAQHDSNQLQLHHISALWMLALMLLRNGSVWMMAYSCQGRLIWSYNILALPCVAAIPLYYAEDVCRGALQNAGVEFPMRRLFNRLAWIHIAVADPSTAQWLFSSTDPMFHCFMVNTYLLVMVVVVVPLVLLWQLERRARWRFHLQQLQQQQRWQQQQQQQQQQQGWQQQLPPPPQVLLLTPNEQLRLLGSMRPGWAAAADLLLFSCAAWALLCLWAAARGYR